MKFYSALAISILLLLSNIAYSQFVYKIKADSLLVTNDSCNAEFNLENRTRDTLGFLYNRGKGRTEFRRAVKKFNDSIYIIGNDTLTLPTTYFQNGLSSFGNRKVIGEFGADTLNWWGNSNLYRPTVLDQAGQPFQWITFNNQFHVTNSPYFPFNQNMGPLSYYTPMRISHELQGFIYLENNYRVTGWNGPNFGILFGNRDPLATKYPSWAGQMIQGAIVLESLGNGAGGTADVPVFSFGLAGDTIYDNRVAAIIGTGTSRYGVHKLPTLAASYRFSIGGGNTPFWEGLAYPYTRFYANAGNQPFVWKNLPWKTQSSPVDTVLSIDYDGQVRQKEVPVAVPMVLASGSASNVASLDINLSSWYTTYNEIEIKLINIRPASNNVELRMRLSPDGSNYDASTGNYKWGYTYVGASLGGGSANNASETFIKIGLSFGNSTAMSGNVKTTISNPSSSTFYPLITGDVVRINYDGDMFKSSFGGSRTNAQVTRGIQFFFSSGNISTVTYKVIGIKN